MVTYLKEHEKMVVELLTNNAKHTDWQSVSASHERKLAYFQHERLIHLFVMLTTSIATLLSFFFTLLLDIPAFFIVTIALLILSLAYVIHYFKLENGVQRLYKISDQLNGKLS